jgi:hypothetical protein
MARGFISFFGASPTASFFVPSCAHGFLSRLAQWTAASIHGKKCRRLVVHHSVFGFCCTNRGECLNDVLSSMLT